RECSSCGFWPGGGAVPEPAFYAYAYPEPAGFQDFPVRPRQAFYSAAMREFILRYDDVRASGQPEQMLLDFCQSTYEAAAERGGGDREILENESTARGTAAGAEKGATFPEHPTEDPGTRGA